MAEDGSFTGPTWLRYVGLLLLLLGASILLLGVVNVGANAGIDNTFTKISIGIWASIPIIITGVMTLWLYQHPCSQSIYFPVILSLSAFLFAPLIVAISGLEVARAVQLGGTRLILPLVVLMLGVLVLVLLVYCSIQLWRYKMEVAAKCAKQQPSDVPLQPSDAIFPCVMCADNANPPPPPLPVDSVTFYLPQSTPIEACQRCSFVLPQPQPQPSQQSVITSIIDTSCPTCQQHKKPPATGAYNCNTGGPNQALPVAYAPNYPIFGNGLERDQLYGSYPQLGGSYPQLGGSYLCSGNALGSLNMLSR